MRILVVCIGNICRSPIAEGLLRHKATQHGLDWHIDSAGTEGYHVGEPPHRFSQAVCMKNGIDISGQRARKFTTRDFRDFDKIYAMETQVYNDIMALAGVVKGSELAKKVDLFLNELQPGSNSSVPDPWYGPEEGYLEVFELIDKAANAIIEKYRNL